MSPANPLVAALLERTLPFLSFSTFIVLFGVYEMLIGISFLIPRAERWALSLFVPHVLMTCGPLILLPAVTWQAFLTPTIEGQYIIKNVLLVAAVCSVAAQTSPSRRDSGASIVELAAG